MRTPSSALAICAAAWALFDPRGLMNHQGRDHDEDEQPGGRRRENHLHPPPRGLFECPQAGPGDRLQRPRPFPAETLNVLIEAFQLLVCAIAPERIAQEANRLVESLFLTRLAVLLVQPLQCGLSPFTEAFQLGNAGLFGDLQPAFADLAGLGDIERGERVVESRVPALPVRPGRHSAQGLERLRNAQHER